MTDLVFADFDAEKDWPEQEWPGIELGDVRPCPFKCGGKGTVVRVARNRPVIVWDCAPRCLNNRPLGCSPVDEFDHLALPGVYERGDDVSGRQR